MQVSQKSVEEEVHHREELINLLKGFNEQLEAAKHFQDEQKCAFSSVTVKGVINMCMHGSSADTDMLKPSFTRRATAVSSKSIHCATRMLDNYFAWTGTCLQTIWGSKSNLFLRSRIS